MTVDVILPKVDMDMATGTISKWHVADGDTVAAGQPIFDIETDKAAMEIEAPGAGVIRIADARAGQSFAIGTVVGRIFAAGETPQAVALAAPGVAAAAQPSPTGVAAAPKAEAPATTASDGVRATPLARRLARERGVALGSIHGSGPRGRIQAADVVQAAASPAGAAPAPSTVYEHGSYEVKPLDGMRRTIAQRLTLAKQTVPHFYLSATCTIDLLLQARERLNLHAPKGDGHVPLWKLSVNDFIIKALALALQQVPEANVTYSDDGLLMHRHSDVGVAVAVEGGLFTPVVRQVERKTLSAIAQEVKQLAARARERKLQPAEYQGGTTAVSNLGMYGVERFSAIINPPQATILAVGAAVERFVPVNRQPVLATQMEATLSCDHRAVDGAVGARLLAAFKALVEDPALMLV